MSLEKVFLILAFMVVTLMQSINGQTAALSKKEALDPSGNVSLAWSAGQDSITFEVEAPTTGYISIGFSPDGTMLQADMCVGWVINGTAFLDDRFSVAYEQPSAKEHQDYNLISGTQVDGITTLRFDRKLVTGDPKDRDITPGIMHIIFAFNDTEPTNGVDIVYHGVNCGTKPVTLIAEKP